MIISEIYIYHTVDITRRMHLYFLLCFQPTCLPPGPRILWAPAWCCRSLFLDTNPLSHNSHLNGFSPVWYLSWFLKLISLISFLGQWLHWNWGPSCDSLCTVRLYSFPNLFPQSLHRYFSSVEWAALSCSLIFCFSLNTKPHEGQGNLELSSLWNCITWRLKCTFELHILSHWSQGKYKFAVSMTASPFSACSRRCISLWSL